MAKLAIKGHPTRGNEVIELLEMLGGNNLHEYVTDSDCFCFYINDKTRIIYYDWFYNFDDKDVTIFTLEEFLEKYPYKIGNKVDYIKYDDDEFSVYEIIGMVWTGNTIEYTLDSFGFTCLAKDIRLHKENNMNKFKSLNVETYLKVWDETEKGLEVLVNDRFELKEDNGKFYIVKKQPEYPKTYEECCKVLCCKPIVGFAGLDDDEENLYGNFIALKRCRDAYWKIAGEEMDLGKPWEPDACQIVYSIGRDSNRISLCNDMFGGYFILEFPTEEIRDAFYENFKNLIEVCKEFL